MTDTSAPASEGDGTIAAGENEPLRSVHTSNFPQILEQSHSSVLVTTYQAGKLVMLRNDGGVLNKHFRNFMKLMGLAISGGRGGEHRHMGIPQCASRLPEVRTS